MEHPYTYTRNVWLYLYLLMRIWTSVINYDKYCYDQLNDEVVLPDLCLILYHQSE